MTRSKILFLFCFFAIVTELLLLKEWETNSMPKGVCRKGKKDQRRKTGVKFRNKKIIFFFSSSCNTGTKVNVNMVRKVK